MTGLLMGALNVLKNILLRMASEAFFEWLFFWAAKMLVESTKTTKDDEFFKQVKKAYEQGK
jgi:hypothetical protein